MGNLWECQSNVSLRTGAFRPAVFPALLPVARDSEGQLFLTNFLYTQSLHKHFEVFVGKKDVLGDLDQDKFAGGDGTDQFVNQALVANPAFLLGLPYTSFKAGFTIPGKDGHLTAYVRDPEDRTEKVLPSMFDEGVIAGGEVRIRIDPWDLPGHQTLGGLWKGFDQPDLDGGVVDPPGDFSGEATPSLREKSDGWVIYYGFDQHLQVYSRETYGEERGWGLFGRASISDGNPNPVRWFLSLGIGGDSPFRGRERDTFGVGWYYIGASDEFGPLAEAALSPRDGIGSEVFYNFAVLPWLRFTPDVQFIRPGLDNLGSDFVFVGGFRVKVSL